MGNMMIRFEDSKGNLISEAGDGTIIKFHREMLINPGLGVPLEEGENLIIFTKENFNKLQENHEHNTKELLRLNHECLTMLDQYMEIKKERISFLEEKLKELHQENDDLKALNFKLSGKLKELKI